MGDNKVPRLGDKKFRTKGEITYTKNDSAHRARTRYIEMPAYACRPHLRAKRPKRPLLSFRQNIVSEVKNSGHSSHETLFAQYLDNWYINISVSFYGIKDQQALYTLPYMASLFLIGK